MQDFILVFIIGLTGGWHCAGMCGGLVSAFSLNMPNTINKFKLIFCLNIGRIFSYCLIGFILGFLSQSAEILQDTQIIKNILFLLSNIILLILGLYFVGLSLFINKIESIGIPIWRVLNPILGKILPIDSLIKSFVFGTIWGWIPCGLVYSVSIYSFLSASAYRGFLIMLSFGLGTLPNLLSMGYFTSLLGNFVKKKIIRLIIGIFFIIFSLFRIVDFLFNIKI